MTNSIEVLSDKGDDTHRAEELDWFMEIVGKSESRPVGAAPRGGEVPPGAPRQEVEDRGDRPVALFCAAESGLDMTTRCSWATNEFSIRYHDEEWGVPVHDDRLLFEFLVLEGAQAGLSWDTILRKRERYREVFDNFDPAVVARYGKRKVKALLRDAGIVRNRLKIAAAIGNAQAFLKVAEEFGSFDAYIWQFIGGRPRVNAWRTLRSCRRAPRNPTP